MFSLRSIVVMVIAAAAAMSVHEMAHALVSYLLGDPTAKMQGRLSLNPFRHIDWLGVLCLVIFHFGWAKPVSIDPYYYKDRKTGIIWTSFAGPVANFLLAFVSIFVLFLIARISPTFMYSTAGSFVYDVLVSVFSMNLGFGVFNLIPIPPLDGSKILFAFLPDDQYYRFIEGSPFFMALLVVLLYLGILSTPLAAIQNQLADILISAAQFLLGM